MSDFDLIVRNGKVLCNDRIQVGDIGVSGETITALAANLRGTAKHEIDASGLHIFPGVIDAHVHFNEPGRADWEGIATGSQAFAAGGGTLFFDMPLNAHPPTINGEAFDLKVAAAERQSVTDFALWGGLVPENLESLEELADRGVIGFKAFMSDSGIDDFHRVDDRHLSEGMKRAAKLGLLVAVHAESETLTKRLAKERIEKGQTSIRDYLDSRPIAAELDAIRRAIEMAGETGCALHIVHVSSAAGVAMVADAKRAGVNVTCETCPHYFTLNDGDVETIGALAKCAPPLRSSTEQELLWGKVVSGDVDTIGSDHSPSPPEMKTDPNFFKVWGGISGVQHTLPLILTKAEGNEAALPLLINQVTQNVAKRFKLPKTKGAISVGANADFVLVDLARDSKVEKEILLYRHKQSPYIGKSLRGKIVRTVLRGTTVFHDGKIVAKPSGRLVKSVK